MTVDFDSKDLGNIIGTTISNTNNAKQDFFESEQSPDQQLVGINNIIINFNTTRVKAKNLGTSSFVIDHPVYGYLDSSTLALDGGYGPLGITTAMIINNLDTFRDTFMTSDFIVSSNTTASINSTLGVVSFGISSSVLFSNVIAKDPNRLFSTFTITGNFTGTIHALVTGNAEAGSPTYTTVTLLSGIGVSGSFNILGSSIGYKLLSTDGVLQGPLIIKYT